MSLEEVTIDLLTDKLKGSLGRANQSVCPEAGCQVAPRGHRAGVSALPWEQYRPVINAEQNSTFSTGSVLRQAGSLTAVGMVGGGCHALVASFQLHCGLGLGLCITHS